MDTFQAVGCSNTEPSLSAVDIFFPPLVNILNSFMIITHSVILTHHGLCFIVAMSFYHSMVAVYGAEVPQPTLNTIQGAETRTSASFSKIHLNSLFPL